MDFNKTELEGVYVIDNFSATDIRGNFVKTFNQELFKDTSIQFEIAESFFSISKQDVIRGMHFQLPPEDHSKLVYVPVGAIIDVIVDLRVNSQTYKNFITVELSSVNRKSVYIPKGFAHGFKSLKDNTVTVYNVSSVYNPTLDSGILYNSLDFNWDVKEPIVSKRDKTFQDIKNFKSPFRK